MAPTKEKIIYTYTDEAPALATHSFLPIVEAITRAAKVELELRDISLAARVLSQFPECVTPEQVVSDDLAELGELAKTPEANIIKLPNISASIPQLLATIKELQEAGFAIPDYPTIANSPEELDIKNRFDRVKGSAVNPVLREGNSDRRAPKAVKEYAQNNPHRMGEWSSDSKTSVATMTNDDFAHNEKSVTVLEDGNFRIEHVNEDMEVTVLTSRTPVQKGDILDGTFMSVNALRSFLREQIQAAKEQNVLFSIHMKATMMKVSDPIIFGHCVSVFYKDVFEKHAEIITELGVDVRNGLGDLYAKIEDLPPEINAEIKDFAMRAKNKKLTPAEIEGSTFTISNLGMFGIESFTSIINQPNSAILSIGAIVQKPIVKSGEIIVGNTMKLTLACDHRTVDGATGSMFLKTLKEFIENPVSILI